MRNDFLALKKGRNHKVSDQQISQQVNLKILYINTTGFPGDSVVKNPPSNAGEPDLVPGSRRSPGEENGNPLHYSYLENPLETGAWWAIVHRISKESDMTQRLNNHHI